MNKTFSFAIIHFSIAFLVTWAITGSWMAGGAVALIEPAINTAAFFFHEKIWQGIEVRESQQANKGSQPEWSALAAAKSGNPSWKL